MAQRKKGLIKEGKLDKHGKPNSSTPKDFLTGYKSVEGASSTATLGSGDAAAATPATPIKEESSSMDVDTPSTDKKVKKEKKAKKDKKKDKKKKDKK